MSNKIAIVGSRTYPVTKEWWNTVLDVDGRERVSEKGKDIVRNFMSPLGDVTIISGGAAGPDSWGIEIADELGFPSVVIRPNWKKFGKGAGFKRNSEIVAAADDVVAFWDLESNGTWDTIKKAAKAEKDLMVFGPSGDLWFFATEEDYRGEPGLFEKLQNERFKYFKR